MRLYLEIRARSPLASGLYDSPLGTIMAGNFVTGLYTDSVMDHPTETYQAHFDNEKTAFSLKAELDLECTPRELWGQCVSLQSTC